MKRVLMALVAFMGICLGATAQNFTYKEFFKNEKLGIFHAVMDRLDPFLYKHSISFNNYTNNNIRVTYKAHVRAWVVQGNSSSTPKDFTYTSTIYIQPNNSVNDCFDDNNSVRDYLRRNGGYSKIDNARVLLVDFELINYGVENKNYETTY